jgi:hypothetical protein
VATFFPENVNDEWGQNPPFYLQMEGYYDNEIVDKKWLNWTGVHGDFFTPNCTSLDPSGDNDSVAVINWFNAAHPPSTPFTPSGPGAGYTQASYGYTSGTVDPNGYNVSYEFNWGDGTNNVTGYMPSGTNVTVYHSWNSAGTYNVTVRAQDAINWSTWSQPWTVTMVNPTLTISASPSYGGTTNPAPGQYSENYGANVTVTATPASGYYFSGWLLDGTDYSYNPITVTMTAAHSLTACFHLIPPGGCVLSNTRITMADGKTMPVQTVKPGDNIMGYDVQAGTFVTETVTSNEHTTVDEILSINNGLLYVTPTDQPIYTDHGWVKNPQDLMVGWKIYDPTTNAWTTVQSVTRLEGHFLVYDLRATQPNTFIGNGILLDRKTQ